jgi:hypothetical protein
MSGFTEEIRWFLASQRIDESEVYDASHLSSRQYKRAMERAGKLFAIVSSPCYEGHYLKSHKGHCIQCNTARISFVKGPHTEAYVYIAGSRSERVLKVGSSESPWDRAAHLNQRSYGGISDWTLLYYTSFPNAGQIELNIHSMLSAYVSPRKYFNDRWEQESREIFACAYHTVKIALYKAASTPVAKEWEHHLAKQLWGFEGYLLPREAALQDDTEQ